MGPYWLGQKRVPGTVEPVADSQVRRRIFLKIGTQRLHFQVNPFLHMTFCGRQILPSRTHLLQRQTKPLRQRIRQAGHHRAATLDNFCVSRAGVADPGPTAQPLAGIAMVRPTAKTIAMALLMSVAPGQSQHGATDGGNPSPAPSAITSAPINLFHLIKRL